MSNAEPSNESPDIFLGKIVKPFGIKGELKFVPSEDFWEDVFASRELVMRRLVNGEVSEAPVAIDRGRVHKNNYVIKLEGVDDRNAAEAEVGGEIYVDRDRLDVDLPEHELPFQVVGATVKTEEGSVVGKVTSVMFSAAHNVYEVTGEDRVVLIPAVPEFVVARDAESGEITIRPIPGLIDD